jgi:hypothetical protein
MGRLLDMIGVDMNTALHLGGSLDDLQRVPRANATLCFTFGRGPLEEHPPQRKTQILGISGMGEDCVNCLYYYKDIMSLERHGWSDKVDVNHIRYRFGLKQYPDPGLLFMKKNSALSIVHDILYQFMTYYRPIERTGGLVDALHDQYLDQLVALAERPYRQGMKAFKDAAQFDKDLDMLIQQASLDFEDLAGQGEKAKALRTVFISGIVYSRMYGEFIDKHLVRRLNAKGLRRHCHCRPLGVSSRSHRRKSFASLQGDPQAVCLFGRAPSAGK